MLTRTEDVTIDGRLTVVARPEGDGPWPGVVMLHEIFGVDDVLRRQADRLAAAGYLVHAPDLFGEGARLGCMVRTLRALSARSGLAWELIELSRQRLLADPACTGKVGVIGFCMGGGFALVLGSADSGTPAAGGYDVSAVNYGMVPADIDDLATRSCPVVASYGGRDGTAKKVPQLTQALSSAGVPHDVKVYPTAGHSFLNAQPNGPRLLRPLFKIAHVGPEPAAAADAWDRIEAFFAAHLGGPVSS